MLHHLITRSNRSMCLLRRYKNKREFKQYIADFNVHSLKYNDTEDTWLEVSVEEKRHVFGCMIKHVDLWIPFTKGQ